MTKRIGILTGGGDVPPLNAVLSAAKEISQELGIELIGFIRGWEGVINENFINLASIPIDPLTGGTILKSSRTNLLKIRNGPEKALETLTKHHVSGLIVIGGEDTLRNAFLLSSFHKVLISKTIDNDVGSIAQDGHKDADLQIINYFTLGYPTAAEKLSSLVSLKEGLRTTAYSHDRIIIVESMGMHAGWLALASAMGSPDFIIIPEFPLNYDIFIEKVIAKFSKQKNIIIVVAEGARWTDSSYLYAQQDEDRAIDHPRFGGSANALQSRFKKDLTKYFSTRNINAINPSYLYRSGAPNKIDRLWAQKLGKKAVKILATSDNKSVFLAIQKKSSHFSIEEFPTKKFPSIDHLHRFVDKRFYNETDYKITEIGRSYLSKIISELPSFPNYGIKG